MVAAGHTLHPLPALEGLASTQCTHARQHFNPHSCRACLVCVVTASVSVAVAVAVAVAVRVTQQASKPASQRASEPAGRQARESLSHTERALASYHPLSACCHNQGRQRQSQKQATHRPNAHHKTRQESIMSAAPGSRRLFQPCSHLPSSTSSHSSHLAF